MTSNVRKCRPSNQVVENTDQAVSLSNDLEDYLHNPVKINPHNAIDLLGQLFMPDILMDAPLANGNKMVCWDMVLK